MCACRDTNICRLYRLMKCMPRRTLTSYKRLKLKKNVSQIPQNRKNTSTKEPVRLFYYSAFISCHGGWYVANTTRSRKACLRIPALTMIFGFTSIQLTSHLRSRRTTNTATKTNILKAYCAEYYPRSYSVLVEIRVQYSLVSFF